MPGGNDRIENRAVQVARTFFQACTKMSEDDEDILPQEDAVDYKLSVFRLFTELFPEFSNKGFCPVPIPRVRVCAIGLDVDTASRT